MQSNELKTKLLETNVFIDNDYLDLYIDLVLNHAVEKKKFKTQCHHILQRAYFLHFNLPVDNSKENIVELEYKYHVLAHYYLIKCTIDWLKWSNQSCFWPMVGRKDIEGLDDLLNSLDDLQEEYEDFCIQNSKNNSGSKNGNYGHYWTDEQRKRASEKIKTIYTDDAMRKKISDSLIEYYSKNESASLGRKACFSLTEEKVIYRYECPDGYTTQTPAWYKELKSDSYFKKGNTITTGFAWYTNGVENIFCLPENKKEGFYKGRVGCFGNLTGKHAYHNAQGDVIYMTDADNIPEGFVKGGIYKGDNSGEKNPSFARHWFTNGEINIHDKISIEDCPEGFRKGQTRGKKSFKLHEYYDLKERGGV